MAQHISRRAHKHAHLSVKRGHAAKRTATHFLHLLRHIRKFQPAIALDNPRKRSKRSQSFGEHDWTCTGTTATMRCRERLVQIDVHGVNAEVSRAYTAHNGVEVRAIAVEIPANIMESVGNLLNVFFKETTRVRVCEHNRSNIRSELGLECFHIYAPVFRRRNGIYRVAQQCCCRGICSVGAFGHENAGPRVAFTAGFQCCMNGHHSAEFPMCACFG